MDKFKEGNIVYHKATRKRCVVISIDEKNKKVKVRTEEDLERDYFPQELKTEEEKKQEDQDLYNQIPKKDWSI